MSRSSEHLRPRDYSVAPGAGRGARAAPPAPQSRCDERTIPAALAGLRIDQALARMFPEHSRSRLAAWLKAGRATVDGSRVDPKRRVWGGERVALAAEPEPARGAAAAQPIPLAIVYEDEDLLVIDKPAGLVVHPGSGNRDGTLLNAVLHHAPGLAALPRAGIVHRLDKDTSGLLVVAKTPEAQTALVRQLAARTVTRQYLALVHGAVARDGRVEAPIGRHPTARTRMAVTARGKPAATRYRVLARYRDATLLECTLETGRTHQIRVHLASIGHPLVGDPVYGGRRAAAAGALGAFRRQALHATRLALVHPRTGARLEWESPMPADFAALCAALA
ncbi:MAG: 23S rRNA pseudouridine(1911/1915/1917) synthase RluD [Burkholderiales bacterium]|nr:23S rRNA pseudouridine(1911/1915/1917) synthase RluD [Burkholderiales bacterium]